MRELKSAGQDVTNSTKAWPSPSRCRSVASGGKLTVMVRFSGSGERMPQDERRLNNFKGITKIMETTKFGGMWGSRGWPAAHHHPAGDAPRRGERSRASTAWRASPATARQQGASRPFRAPPHHLGCGADRRGMCRCRAMCRWPTMACSSWMSGPVPPPYPGGLAPTDRGWCRDNRPCVGGDHGSYPTQLFETLCLLALESRPKT